MPTDRTIRSFAFAALSAATLVLGCASPISVRIADPDEVQRYLTRSALTGSEPSDFSQNELRRYDLQKEYTDDPESALEKLYAAALEEALPPNALFALSELWFLRARKTERQADYATAMIYGYALLFPEKERAPLAPLDPRERVAADLYNRALACAFERTEQGTITLEGSTEIAVAMGRLRVTIEPGLLQLDGAEFYDLQPVTELEIRGLRNRYRRPGLGAPLAAKTRPLPGAEPIVPVASVMRTPLTVVLIIDSPLAGLRSGDLEGRLQLYPSLETEAIEIDGREVRVEAEPTASLAASLADSQFWKHEFWSFLGSAFGVRTESALFGFRPYAKGRIPVVFVHGTASSAGRWADMVNDLIADVRLRDRYAYWFFIYDSGNPIAYSAYQLRAALKRAMVRGDPDGTDPCLGDMVVMGHSQGGLLTKLTVIDSGDLFWSGISDQPFDDLDFPPEQKQVFHDTLFVKPLPFVSEVIFLATPQRGSYLAGPQFVRRLAGYFVRLPSDVVGFGVGLATLAPAGGAELAVDRLPTSIDNMSPGNRFIQALSEIPVDEGVIAHSIIAVDSDDPLESAGDGVVKYESAHLDDVESELIVRSPHSGMQAAPATVEEVRRILVDHSARSACPPRGD